MIGHVPFFDDDIRQRKAGGDVALIEFIEAAVVASLYRSGSRLVVVDVRMDQLGAGPERLLGVEDRGHRLVADLDLGKRGPRQSGRRGGHRCDHIPEVRCLLADLHKQPLVLDHGSVAEVGHVAMGDDGVDAGHRLRRGGVDLAQVGVWVLGEQERTMEHSGKRQVGQVARPARHLLESIEAAGARADHGFRR